ncbi:Kae1-associated serine/threonine protein kinase [Candidatus Woesearchaeota archaeon]|nr:Kae1-associated serine/threonine protein kinase [Candidatus Woesearchaeota archaeon]
MKQIGRGAEAVIYSDGSTVQKHRIEKGYRLPEIDISLRKSRTRREAKVLEKLYEIGFPAPKLKQMCDKEMKIDMEHVKGEKLRDVLDDEPGLAKEVGRKVGLMHSNGIIHGDLTTSNMIMDDEIKFIDFGLSFFSEKEEHKAVDLHLLRQALESKHYKVWEKAFEYALEGYAETCTDHSTVLQRLEKVEARGRNKNKL